MYIGAKGAFRKILGSVTKNGYLKIVQGGPFGSAGGRIPEEGRGADPPKSAPALNSPFYTHIFALREFI